MSDAWNELGRRAEAVDAARKAGQFAATESERVMASKLAYIAQTDMAVLFERDAEGRAQAITTRVPHQTAADWNPFVEAGDDIRSVSGRLRDIDCGTGPTRVRVESAGSVITLAIADPARVRMRNAPDEFVCGPQENALVDVQYAASKNGAVDGLVRGIDFRR